MNVEIRPADPADYGQLTEIGLEGDAGGVDARYLSFVATHGRLLAAVSAGSPDVLAFGGMVPVGDVAMVSDLFVAAAARGNGIGGAVLRGLVAGRPRRMTFSSKHPAALPVYRRAGMSPRWRLLYLRGMATGGGPPLHHGPWAGGRADLVQHFAAAGSIVSEHLVVSVTDSQATIERLQHPDPQSAMAAVLAALPSGLSVRACVPEHQPLAAWLADRGFVVEDHDIFCAAPGVEFPTDVTSVHPGLA